MKIFFSWCFAEKILTELENILIDNHLELCVNQSELSTLPAGCGGAVSSFLGLLDPLRDIETYSTLFAFGCCGLPVSIDIVKAMMKEIILPTTTKEFR